MGLIAGVGNNLVHQVKGTLLKVFPGIGIVKVIQKREHSFQAFVVADIDDAGREKELVYLFLIQEIWIEIDHIVLIRLIGLWDQEVISGVRNKKQIIGLQGINFPVNIVICLATDHQEKLEGVMEMSPVIVFQRVLAKTVGKVADESGISVQEHSRPPLIVVKSDLTMSGLTITQLSRKCNDYNEKCNFIEIFILL